MRSLPLAHASYPSFLGTTRYKQLPSNPKRTYDTIEQETKKIHPDSPLPYTFPSKLSTLLFKSRFITSNPGPAFRVLSEKFIASKNPEKSSLLTNVVCPGVVRLGWNSKKCFPRRMPFQPPSQTKRSGEFS